MKYPILKAFWCLAFLSVSGLTFSQEDYFNAAILVIDGQPALVTLDDRDEISDILMYLPDYFQSNRTDEEYVELLKNTYALGAIEINQRLRFLEFPGHRDDLTSESIVDLKHLAGLYNDSEDCLDVIVSAVSSPRSKGQIDNIIHSLRAFGIPKDDIKVEVLEAFKSLGTDIVKVRIDDDQY